MFRPVKSILLITVCFIFLAACSSPADKSIFDTLTLDELKDITSKEPGFEKAYRFIEKTKFDHLGKDIDKVRWRDLSYQRVYDMYAKMVDSSHGLLAKAQQAYGAEWEKKYGDHDRKGDSVSLYWRQQSEAFIDQFVSIEIVGLSCDDHYNEPVCFFSLKLVPQQQNVDELEVICTLLPKKEGVSNNELVPQKYKLLKPLTLTKKIDVLVNKYVQKQIYGLSFDSLIANYDIFFDTDKLRIGDNTYTAKDIGIPECVKDYWYRGYGRDAKLKMRYKAKMIQELVDKNYQLKNDYCTANFVTSLKDQDSLACSFMMSYYYQDM